MLHAKAPKIRYGPMSLSYLQSYMCELAEIDLKDYLGGEIMRFLAIQRNWITPEDMYFNGWPIFLSLQK